MGFESLQARSRFPELQRPVSSESVHLVLHHARLSGDVYLLPVAPDAFRPSLASAFERRYRQLKCRYVLENFPGLKEIFFDDDTFNYRKARTIELCAEAEEAELHLVAARRASPPITTR